MLLLVSFFLELCTCPPPCLLNRTCCSVHALYVREKRIDLDLETFLWRHPYARYRAPYTRPRHEPRQRQQHYCPRTPLRMYNRRTPYTVHRTSCLRARCSTALYRECIDTFTLSREGPPACMYTQCVRCRLLYTHILPIFMVKKYSTIEKSVRKSATRLSNSVGEKF